MTENRTWFITGAGRGMGTDIARAALAAGHAVAATGRNPDAVSEAVGEADDRLVVALDITNRKDGERDAAQQEWWEGPDGKQGGDPAELAQALLTTTAATGS
jgi:NAD(P)-dependent dehydrogenase (short-subunit alcohol dehydrogenase family)